MSTDAPASEGSPPPSPSVDDVIKNLTGEKSVSTITPDKRTFPEHLLDILNGVYTVNMRRSVQTCVLIEADRCLNLQYGRLKAFQRKVALHDTATDIVETLTFIPSHHRVEIMYRTASSKVMLSPELTWRRMKLIDREIKKTIVPKIMELVAPGKTHDEVCKEYLQLEYEKVSGKTDPYHPNWEYSHDNHFTAYRMYYLGAEMNPNLPPAVDPNPHRVVPSVKPRPEVMEAPNPKRNAHAGLAALQTPNGTETPSTSSKRQRMATSSYSPYTPGRQSHAESTEERRALLKEIKDHLEILNEFKGVVPESDLNERKRSLYAILPKL